MKREAPRQAIALTYDGKSAPNLSAKGDDELAEAILAIVESGNPPALMVLGKDAFDAFAAVAQAQRTELDQWRDLSLSTGIEG